MAAQTKEEVLAALTVLEAAELSKMLEEKWGVSAAASVAVAAPFAGGPPMATDFEVDVVLTGDGGRKINVIKEVRSITGLGLTEAKALVERAPVAILEGTTPDRAEAAKVKLEEAGATIQLDWGDEGDVETADDAEVLREVIAQAMSSLDSPDAHLAYIRSRLASVHGTARV